MYPFFSGNLLNEKNYPHRSTGDDPSFPRNHIKVFPIQKGDYVERIRFETEIYSVCTTTKYMFVVSIFLLHKRFLLINFFSKKNSCLAF